MSHVSTEELQNERVIQLSLVHSSNSSRNRSSFRRFSHPLFEMFKTLIALGSCFSFELSMVLIIFSLRGYSFAVCMHVSCCFIFE